MKKNEELHMLTQQKKEVKDSTVKNIFIENNKQNLYKKISKKCCVKPC